MTANNKDSNNSNVVQIDDHATPTERASQWIARIDAGPLNADERQALKEWLASHPDNAALLDTQALLWSHASRARFAQASASRAHAFTHRWSSLRFQPKALGLALCSVVLAAVLAVSLMPSLSDVQSARYATDVGKRSDVKLADGSVIHLNTASRTTVAYTGKRRLVILERGEGYFEVAKDRSRPFDVLAGTTIVRAVGTKFSVRRMEGDRVEVIVTEGVVELLRKDGENMPVEAKFSQPVRLARGQSGLQLGSSLLVTQRDEKRLENNLSWLEGRLSFDSEPLSDIVAQVNRYSIKRIVIGDPSLRELKVSGSFNVGEVPVFLNSLEQGFGLRAEEANGVVTITRRAP